MSSKQDASTTTPPQAPALEVAELATTQPSQTDDAPALSLFIAALDATIVATATPTISSQFKSASGYFWIGSAYLLAGAASGPIWARLSDIWGRKPALLGSVALFFLSSTLAATSVDMRMLIAARALQGTAGGGLIQLVNIVISDLFSVRHRSLFFGLVESVWALAGGLGPVLGGAFTELASWRYCFWINLPISGVAFVLLSLYLDVHNPCTKFKDGIKAIDWFGTFGILGVILMLLLGLDFGGVTFPWSSPTVICLIIFGAIMIVVFLVSEKKLATYPLMPLYIFRNRGTSSAMCVVFCQGVVYIATDYFLPLYFQSAKGASPLRSGVLILPLIVTEAIMGILSGIIMHRTGRYRELIWLGCLLLTVGTGLYIIFDVDTSIGVIIGLEIVEGIGAGLLFQPPLVAVQAMTSQADTATATATLGFVRNVGTALSVVLGGVVFQNSMETRAPSLRAAGLNSTLIAAFSNGEAAASVLSIRNIVDMDQRNAVKHAFSWSLRNLWIMFTIVAAFGLVGSAFVKHQEMSREHTETTTGVEKMTRRDGAQEEQQQELR